MEPRRIIACPVCCTYYARDCDLLERTLGATVWDCESNDPRYQGLDCGFSVPAGTPPKEIQGTLYRTRLAELQAMGAPKSRRDLPKEEV